MTEEQWNIFFELITDIVKKTGFETFKMRDELEHAAAERGALQVWMEFRNLF